MTRAQKHTLGWMILIGLAYFAIFWLPNDKGAKDEHMLFLSSHDETVTYPYVVKMLTPGKDIHETRSNLLIYGDYHYGYPFYFLSMLVLLPVRLIYGDQFTAHTQLNLLLLRQMISVLPMILSIGLLVYLQTRLESRWRTLGLFVLMLSVQGFVRNNINWWHPDALTLLAIMFTFFFLVRDDLRFGIHFYLAAAACGMAIAIKLAGFFFFLAIGGYLLAGILQKRITWQRAVLHGVMFIVTMMLVAILSNPFLFYKSARERMFQIQSEHSYIVTHGWQNIPNSKDAYEVGPATWIPTLTGWYAPLYYLAFLVVSLLAGCLWGRQKLLNRLMLAWIAPYAIYLLFFVAIKPDHYWLPVMLPLFSTAFNLTLLPAIQSAEKSSRWRTAAAALTLLVVLLAGLQFTRSLNRDYPLYMRAVLQEVQ
jgi:4-amino-4-deoxy-L-arabinose transferase-like glycosyltransferase